MDCGFLMIYVYSKIYYLWRSIWGSLDMFGWLWILWGICFSIVNYFRFLGIGLLLCGDLCFFVCGIDNIFMYWYSMRFIVCICLYLRYYICSLWWFGCCVWDILFCFVGCGLDRFFWWLGRIGIVVCCEIWLGSCNIGYMWFVGRLC